MTKHIFLFMLPFQIPNPILILLLPLGKIVFELLFGSKYTPKEATNIAIFGMKGVGKTTLWNQLRNRFDSTGYITTVGKSEIPEFEIEYNGVKKRIKKSTDFGGGDDLVKYYKDIIEAETFIYYLINLNGIDSDLKTIRARIKAISNCIKEKDINSSTGIYLVGTHYKEYFEKTGKSKEEAKASIAEIFRMDNSKDFGVKDIILIAELTVAEDIEQFYQQIVN